MTYIYDILLNFNKNLVECFQWNDSDKIKYVKRIVLFKVDSKVIKDIIYNDVLLDDSFINMIPKYEINGEVDSNFLCLLCDGMFVIGLYIKSNKPVLVSRMLLDEEQEVIEITNSLSNTLVSYKVLSKNSKLNCLLTRREFDIRDALRLEFDRLYKDNCLDKLMYFYYEFTNKECHNIDYIYNYLVDSLDNFSKGHVNLFEIINMSSAI